jgi:hypothetical protein
MAVPTHGRTGRWFAVAAVLVTAPRLVLAFLAADSIALPPALRAALLSASSVATAVVLTGGAAYLAHAIAMARGDAGGRLLRALWLAILICSSALMAPALAAGLTSSPLGIVLNRPVKRWAWAVCAVVAVDLVAAAVMQAEAAARRHREDREADHERAIAELIAQRDRARAELAEARREAARNAAAGAASANGQRRMVGEPAPGGTGGNTDLGERDDPAEHPAPVPASGADEAAGDAPRWVCPCGRQYRSQQGLAAHSKWCELRPTLIDRKT